MKEDDIRSSFVFSDTSELKPFYEKLTQLTDTRSGGRYDALDLIIDENYARNPILGYHLLELIVNGSNEVNHFPHVVFRNQLNTLEVADKVWNLIESRPFAHKTAWKLSFFYNLSEPLVSSEHSINIVQMIGESDESIRIDLDSLTKFLKADHELFQNILRAILAKNKEGGAYISILGQSFIDHYSELGNDLHLIQETYLQQSLVDHHFDYEGEGFTRILEQNPNFLVEYFDVLCSRNNRISLPDDHLNRGFVWQIDEIDQQVARVLDMIAQNEPCLGINDHFCDSFFRNLQRAEEERSKEFLLNYITTNHTNYQKIDVAISIVRRSKKELFESVLLHYLSLNQNVEAFSKIWWRGNGGTYSGDVIFGDIEAADWRNILSIVKKSNVGIGLLPIKKYLNQKIECCLRSADRERQRRFLERD